MMGAIARTAIADRAVVSCGFPAPARIAPAAAALSATPPFCGLERATHRTALARAFLAPLLHPPTPVAIADVSLENAHCARVLGATPARAAHGAPHARVAVVIIFFVYEERFLTLLPPPRRGRDAMPSRASSSSESRACPCAVSARRRGFAFASASLVRASSNPACTRAREGSDERPPRRDVHTAVAPSDPTTSRRVKKRAPTSAPIGSTARVCEREAPRRLIGALTRANGFIAVKPTGSSDRSIAFRNRKPNREVAARRRGRTPPSRRRRRGVRSDVRRGRAR